MLTKDKDHITNMFDTIAPKYDMLNHLLTLGIDKIWRKRVVNIVRSSRHDKVLDLAAGTGDLTIAMAKGIDDTFITGVDFSKGMLDIASKKVDKEGLSSRIVLREGDALNLEFPECYFDIVTVAFGVRNFQNLEKGLSEIYKVINNGGRVVILELSVPQNKIFNYLFMLYFTKILPSIGSYMSKSDFAYEYLPLSVKTFAVPHDFCSILSKVGFKDCRYKSLCGGIASIYTATKTDIVL